MINKKNVKNNLLFKILGSGGCTSIPKAGCRCNICSEARIKGEPYKRTGSSLYIENFKILIDTPEDINYQLNKYNIFDINILLYSHWDPDHTLGLRVIEQLKLSWLDYFRNIHCKDPIKIIGLPEVISDINNIKNKFGSFLDYYYSHNLCTINSLEHIEVNSLNITLVPIKSSGISTAFIFENYNSKLIYAPCDNKPFPNDDRFLNADIAILGGFIPKENFNNNTYIPLGNKIYDAMFTIDEIIEIKNKYNFKKIILTHLEENWGKSFDDYLELEKDLQKHNIFFAFDGMEIFL
ncbi:metallo-hydrolase/oxidoreductase [Clostridium carnis]